MKKLREGQERLLSLIYGSIDIGSMSSKTEEEEVVEKILERLGVSPIGALVKWRKKIDKERTLEEIVSTHCSLLDIKEPKRISIEESKEFKVKEENGKIILSATTAKFDSTSETLRVFTFKELEGKGINPFNDFSEVLSSVIHENMHNYQLRLVLDYLKDPESERPLKENRAVIKLFALNSTVGGYIEGSETTDGPYARQPIEKHAIEIGKAVKECFVKKVKAEMEALVNPKKSVAGSGNEEAGVGDEEGENVYKTLFGDILESDDMKIVAERASAILGDVEILWNYRTYKGAEAGRPAKTAEHKRAATSPSSGTATTTETTSPGSDTRAPGSRPRSSSTD